MKNYLLLHQQLTGSPFGPRDPGSPRYTMKNNILANQY